MDSRYQEIFGENKGNSTEDTNIDSTIFTGMFDLDKDLEDPIYKKEMEEFK